MISVSSVQSFDGVILLASAHVHVTLSFNYESLHGSSSKLSPQSCCSTPISGNVRFEAKLEVSRESLVAPVTVPSEVPISGIGHVLGSSESPSGVNSSIGLVYSTSKEFVEETHEDLVAKYKETIRHTTIVTNPRFHPIIATEMEHVNSCGRRRSKALEIWAMNTFDEWRVFHGFSIDETIEELSKTPNVHHFVDMLCKFTLQVRKKGGTIYPPCIV